MVILDFVHHFSSGDDGGSLFLERRKQAPSPKRRKFFDFETSRNWCQLQLHQEQHHIDGGEVEEEERRSIITTSAATPSSQSSSDDTSLFQPSRTTAATKWSFRCFFSWWECCTKLFSFIISWMFWCNSTTTQCSDTEQVTINTDTAGHKNDNSERDINRSNFQHVDWNEVPDAVQTKRSLASVSGSKSIDRQRCVMEQIPSSVQNDYITSDDVKVLDEGEDETDDETCTSYSSTTSSSSEAQQAPLSPFTPETDSLTLSSVHTKNIDKTRRQSSIRFADKLEERHMIQSVFQFPDFSPEDLWYTSRELTELRRQVLMVQARDVVMFQEHVHWRTTQWWIALQYFHNKLRRQQQRKQKQRQYSGATRVNVEDSTAAAVSAAVSDMLSDERTRCMRSKLIWAYVETHELVGLERILLDLLLDVMSSSAQQQPNLCSSSSAKAIATQESAGGAKTRDAVLQYIHSIKEEEEEEQQLLLGFENDDGGIHSVDYLGQQLRQEKIATYQARMSQPHCQFAHELALAQANALQITMLQDENKEEDAKRNKYN